MKKSWIWLLMIPLMSEAADLKFLSNEGEDHIDLNEITSLFDMELSKVDEDLLLQVEKMSVRKPAFPWVDDEVLDEDISLFVEKEAKEVLQQSNSQSAISKPSEQEAEYFPVFEEVPSRANRFLNNRTPTLEIKPLKPAGKKPQVKEANQNSSANSPKSSLKQQTTENKPAPKISKSGQAKIAKQKAKQKSPVVKNLEKPEKTKAASIPRKRVLKRHVNSKNNEKNQLQQVANIHELMSEEVTNSEMKIQKERHPLPDYFPDWDTE